MFEFPGKISQLVRVPAMQGVAHRISCKRWTEVPMSWFQGVRRRKVKDANSSPDSTKPAITIRS